MLLLKKISKRILQSGFALLLGMGIITAIGVGVAISYRPTSKENISLILSTKNNPFFTQIESAVVQANNNKYDLSILDSENDENKQANNIKNAIALGTKAILINVVNSSTAWASGLDEAYKLNIPIIAIDRPVNTTIDEAIAQTIASNNVQGASDIANWFKNTYNPTISDNVFHLAGVAGAQAAIDRSKGFEESYGKKYLINQIANFSRSEALNLMKTVLQSQGNDFKIIFADNDEMAIGAIDAITSNKYESITTLPYDASKNKYYVLGFDGTDEALKLIEQNRMVATVIQQPKLMGKLAFQAMEDLFANKKIESIQNAATIVVHKGNVTEFIS